MFNKKKIKELENRANELFEYKFAYNRLVIDFEALARNYYKETDCTSVYRNLNGYLIKTPSESEKNLINYIKKYNKEREEELLKEKEEQDVLRDLIKLLQKLLENEKNEL
jgi:hypothetical protein